MRAVNHALTGAAIGLAVGNPLVAAPAAFLSHFALDAIPHYDTDEDNIEKLRSAKFRGLLLTDIVLCGLLVVGLALSRPSHWMLAAVCAFLAASPDFMWLNGFIKANTGREVPPHKNFFVKFHSSVQWLTRPVGAVVEAAWLVVMSLIVVILTG